MIESNSVVALSKRLRSGELTAPALWDAYRERIERIDPLIHAFEAVAPEHLPCQDKVRCKTSFLQGIPFGVKDVIDVAGFPTRAGSMSRYQRPAVAEDAAIVARLRAVGLKPMGKTTTTEFAFIDPAPTRNPHRPTHSPGGSSSGSAAAVAAALVPFALGTQTAGSLCRPAAYCGVAAIKPTHGLIATHGMVPLAQSFDTLGVIARHVADTAVILGLFSTDYGASARRHPRRLGVLADRFHRNSSTDVGDFHEEVLRKVSACGTSLTIIDPPVDFDAITSDHRLVMLYEGFQNHGHLLAEHADALGSRFREALAEGYEIDLSAAQDALGRLHAATSQFWTECADVEALLLQPVPATAPEGRNTTGDQSYLTPWTVFGGPLVVVPGRYDPHGLPLAAMIAAPPGHDARAAEIASWLEPEIDLLPDHVTPT